MTLRHRIVAGGLALVSASAFAAGEAALLTKEEMAAAVRTDDFSIPTPAELMAALNKQGKLDWSAKFRAPIATNYPSRAQLALNLGTLVADGFIAVEAEDAQQVKNLGKDIMSLVKNLGASNEVMMRGSSITDFAERKQWDQLQEELEATQNEVKSSMIDKKDADLIPLVTVGGWMRGTEAITTYLADHYSEGGAKILRQPAIVSYLNQKLDALPDKMRDDPKVKATRVKLIEMEQLIAFPRDKAPSKEDVQKLGALAQELVKEIARKETK
ncbi:MAG TPA: hypothetical protein VGO90_15045 [Chthoniobacteraceae bacterium]|jgi:hypothetical protein|nr:hypothetical protein [Chthoniobacter sp.]HEV7869002.1 hypothetical protein [Chthoniobacteraceae bacterium]